MIEIKMFPAVRGDSFLISVIENTEKINILVDCGYPETFRDWLKPALKRLSREKQILSKLIITHVDSDHVAGAIPLLEANGISSSPKIIPIQEIWHNTYRHFPQGKGAFSPVSFSPKELALLNKIAKVGYPLKNKAANGNVSIQEGTSLGALILKYGYEWNSSFGSQAASIDVKDVVNISDDTKIFMLTPNFRALVKLEAKWYEWLQEAGIDIKSQISQANAKLDDAFEFLLARELSPSKGQINIAKSSSDLMDYSKTKFKVDRSETNRSSISFVLEYKQFKILFLGDAHPDDVFKGLEYHYGPLKKGGLYFDAIKLSHHGSAANLSAQLLEFIDSDLYLVSTDGSIHKHPDIDCIAKLAVRPTNFVRKFVFNYPIQKLLEIHTPQNRAKHSFEFVMPKSLKGRVTTWRKDENGSSILTRCSS